MSGDTVAAALRRAARSRAGGLSVRALAVTLEVNRAPSPLTQVDLRAVLGTAPMQTSRAVDGAVRAGFVRRGHDTDDDRRRVILHHTPDGRFVAAQITGDRA